MFSKCGKGVYFSSTMTMLGHTPQNRQGIESMQFLHVLRVTSSDLAPSNSKGLGEKSAVCQWQKRQGQGFCLNGIEKWVTTMCKRIAGNSDYVQNKLAVFFKRL
jgi:hypothetical protein